VVYKSQQVRREIGNGSWHFYNDKPFALPPRVLIEKAECITFDHNPFRLGGDDVGGPFWSSKSVYESDSNQVVAQGLGRWYEGTLHCANFPGTTLYPTDVGRNPAKPGNFDSLIIAGSTAISRTVPTNPISGASVAIGEAREGFPRFVGSTLLNRTRHLRSVGDEYLNVEFGWKPMIRDLLSFGKSVKESNKVLRQMYRDSGAGNSIHRSYSFPVQKSKSEPDGPKWSWYSPFKCDGSQLDAWMIGSGPIEGGYSQYSTSETKTWFSGAYSYVMPREPTNFIGNLDRWDAEVNKLYGTRLTPSTLWNLAPWSWAADWFSNTGDVLANMSAFSNDSLVLKYGYIMRSTRELHHTTWQGYINQPGGSTRLVSLREAHGGQSKLRLRATPYGFGIDIGSFSPRQIAISAAVGVSQMPRLSL